MGIQDVGSLSIGQWAAKVRGWNKAHAPEGDLNPPTREEFEEAVARARGLH